MFKVKPFGHRVIVKPDTLEASDPIHGRMKAAGLVFAPSEERKREEASVDRGTVLEIGPTAFKDFGGEPWCTVGAYVAYARHAGKWIVDPETDEKVLALNDEDLICELSKKES